jgi:protein-tyrosine phosphatase
MSVDLHCHMLPGIDDGSKSMAQSLAMARIAVDDGIKVSVMTPHHLNGVYSNPAVTVHEAVNELRQALFEVGIGLKVLPGSELHLVPELSEELASGRAMTIANLGKAVLVELPVHTVPMGSEFILEDIIAQGLLPVIAHPERNSQLRKNPDMLADWISMGCLGQVTAQSCTGQFGPQVRQTSELMIRRGLIHIIASDAHRDRRRIPQVSEGREQVAEWTNESTARLLAETYPENLVNGETPDTELLAEALPRQRKGWWRRLTG